MQYSKKFWNQFEQFIESQKIYDIDNGDIIQRGIIFGYYADLFMNEIEYTEIWDEFIDDYPRSTRRSLETEPNLKIDVHSIDEFKSKVHTYPKCKSSKVNFEWSRHLKCHLKPKKISTDGMIPAKFYVISKPRNSLESVLDYGINTYNQVLRNIIRYTWGSELDVTFVVDVSEVNDFKCLNYTEDYIETVECGRNLILEESKYYQDMLIFDFSNYNKVNAVIRYIESNYCEEKEDDFLRRFGDHGRGQNEKSSTNNDMSIIVSDTSFWYIDKLFNTLSKQLWDSISNPSKPKILLEESELYFTNSYDLNSSSIDCYTDKIRLVTLAFSIQSNVNNVIDFLRLYRENCRDEISYLFYEKLGEWMENLKLIEYADPNF